MIVDIGDAAGIHRPALRIGHVFHQRIDVARQAEPAGKVHAGAARHQSELRSAAVFTGRLQKAVRDLARRSVAACRDDQIETGGGEVERQPLGVAFRLRLAQFEVAEMPPERGGCARPVALQPTAPGHRIEDHPDLHAVSPFAFRQAGLRRNRSVYPKIRDLPPLMPDNHCIHRASAVSNADLPA